MREIILDTETTGLDPLNGDRLVEIGCVETINYVATGKTFHVYLNPERDMEPGAMEVTGLTRDFLSDKPLFSEVVDEFLAFIQDAELVIHNGLIINDTGKMAADIRIQGEKIVEIGPKLVAAPGAREIDAHFLNEPLLQAFGNLIECQLAETTLLFHINSNTRFLKLSACSHNCFFFSICSGGREFACV